MHAYDLILTLTGGLTAALVLGYVTQRLGLSPIVGYLLAGTLVGPHTPGFVADASSPNSWRRSASFSSCSASGSSFTSRSCWQCAGWLCLAPSRRAPWPPLWARFLAARSGGIGRRESCSAWRCPSRARWYWCGCWPITTTCIHRAAISPSAGWWSKTRSQSWRWSCCPPFSARRAASRRSGPRWGSRRSKLRLSSPSRRSSGRA